MKYEKIKNTVGYNLFKNVFSVYIIIAIIITIFHMYSEYSNAKSNIFNEMKNTEQVLKKQLISSIWNMNYELLEDIIDGILTSDHIIGISVKINDGKTIGNFGIVDENNKIEKNISFKNKNKVFYEKDLFYIAFDLEDNTYDKTEFLGTITFFSSEDVIYNKVKSNFFLILINSLIKTLALWLIFLYFANKQLTIPLLEMIKTTSSIDSSKLNEINFEHNKHNQNELDILKKTFNKMLKKLHFSHIENIQLNQSLEEKVKQRTQELEFSLNSLNKTQEKLVETEKMASLGSLVSGIAHEINTPVGVGVTGISHILYQTQELEDKYNSEQMSKKDFENYLIQTKELATIIDSNLERTANIIKNFKQVALDQTSEQKRFFRVKDYIKGVLLSIDNIIKKKEINIEVICSDNLEINSYPGFFSQIITNLVINSVRHAFEKKGNINILIKVEDNIMKISYKDDGKGISTQNLSKIFEPFFKATTKRGSAGLGLSIIYNIVTSNLKGEINCISKENEGTSFDITFPIS